MTEPPVRPPSKSFIKPPQCPICRGLKTDPAGSTCKECKGVGLVSLERHQELVFELAKKDTLPPDTEPDPNAHEA